MKLLINEKYGSGIQRIINLFKNENLPLPEFTNISNGFMVTVFADNVDDNLNDDTLNVVENVVGNVVGNRTDKILTLLNQNNKLSALEIAKLLGITERTVQRDLDKLKNNNKIKRIDSYKGGYWQIIDNK